MITTPDISPVQWDGVLEFGAPTPSHCTGHMSGIVITQVIAYFDNTNSGCSGVLGDPLCIYKDFRMSITQHTNLL